MRVCIFPEPRFVLERPEYMTRHASGRGQSIDRCILGPSFALGMSLPSSHCLHSASWENAALFRLRSFRISTELSPKFYNHGIL
jgi:hypothetical protein